MSLLIILLFFVSTSFAVISAVRGDAMRESLHRLSLGEETLRGVRAASDIARRASLTSSSSTYGLGLDQKTCKTYDPTTIMLVASSTMDKADKKLVGADGPFARVSDGFVGTVVNETDGTNSGGGTNTFGSYGSHIFTSEVLPPGMCEIPMNDGANRCASNYTLSLCVGPADVIAYLGCTPPEMRYFSYDVDLTARTTEVDWFFPGVNFGDTVSHLSINTSSTSSEGDSVFDQPILLLISGDRAAANAVADAYISAGFPASAINFKPLPVDDPVRVWDRSKGSDWQISRPDVLSSVNRMTAPTNEAAYRAYQSVYFPARFYFKNNAAKAEEPVAQSTRERYFPLVVDETKELAGALDALSQSVVEAMAAKGLHLVSMQAMNETAYGFYDDWNAVLSAKNNASFVLPDRDALYGIPLVDEKNYQNYLLHDGIVAVAVGINHKSVLNVSYNSVGIDLLSLLTGKALETHWWLDSDLTGSADRYLPASSNPLVPFLFAVDLLGPGGCGGDSSSNKWCAEYQKENINQQASAWPLLLIYERVYLVPETMSGPDADTTVPSRLLVFSS